MTLGEVCEFRRGLTYAKGDEVASGGTAVLRAMNIDLETGELDLSDIRYVSPSMAVPVSKMVEPGTLLICTASGSKKHLGKTALIDRPMEYAFGGFMGLLVPNASILPKFLHWVMRSDAYWQFIDRLSGGTNINNLKFSQLKEFELQLPPLEEQKRIVAVLDEAFEGLDRASANAEGNLADAQEVFSECHRRSFASPDKMWPKVRLDAVTSINSSLVDPRLDQYLDLPHLGAGNMISGTDKLVDIKTAREEGLKSGKYLFDATMVLYSKIRPYLRKVSRPDFAGLCSADVYPLEPQAGQLDRNYLFYLLLGSDFTEYAIKGSARAGMPKVNREHLFAYQFALPALERQQEIASQLDDVMQTVMGLQEAFSRKIEAIETLRQSLLQKAFSGELS